MSDKENNNGHKKNGRVKVPAPLNPHDPMNSFVHSLGDNNDKFSIYQGLDGIPHRGHGVRYYKNDDPPHMRPHQGGQMRCGVFNIANDDEKEAFEKVVSRVYSMQQRGQAMTCAIDRQFIASEKTWLVYYEWVEFFTYDPLGAKYATHAQTGGLKRRS